MKRTYCTQRKTKIPYWFLGFVLSLFVSAFLVTEAAVGQVVEKPVSGVVTDASSGMPLPGVSIIIKGTTTGTITDIDGKYTINVSPEDILVFSYIGFLDEEKPVGEQTMIDVALALDVLGLDEVVVIGYGVQKKKLVTGATTQVKSDDIINNHALRVESSIQGLTPGMVLVKQSGQPGSDYNISIRGLSSPNGNQPLVLIDGVPGDLKSVNPSDVESVDVLKDAASAAIYGSRGGNGVILITTKKGEVGKQTVTYDFSYGISNPTHLVEMANASEYAMLMNEASYNENPSRPLPFTQEYIDAVGEGTNWLEEALNPNAPQVNHYLGFSGGNEKSNYLLSLSYNKEEGIFDYEGKSRYERFNIRINSEHKMTKWLAVGENISYQHRNTRALGTGNQYNNFIRSALEASPLLEVYDDASYDGFARMQNNEISGVPVPSDQQGNPIAYMHYKYNDKDKYDDIIGNIYAEAELIKGLKIRTDMGAKLNYFIQTNATDSFSVTPYDTDNPDPEYKQLVNRDFGYNWDNTITYENDLGDHSFLAMIGSNVQDNWYFDVEARGTGYLTNDAPVLNNITTMVRDSVIGDFGKGDARFSYFGRLSYNYKEKYLATVSLRRDASSRFGKNNRVGYFPAVSAGWVISEEKFLESASWLDFMKLRASWGQNGLEPSEPYQFLATVSANDRFYQFGSQLVGVSPDLVPNPDLKWEAQEQIDIGFDSRFLRDFNFSFDWYKKTAKNWIVSVPIPAYTGIAAISESTDPFINGGDVINSGVELDLGYNKRIGDLYLGIRANLAYNSNEVQNVPGEIIHGSGSVLYNGSDEFYRVEEGYPIGYFWGYVTDGIFQTQAEVDAYVNSEDELLQRRAVPGDVKRVDLNEDGVLNDEDKTMIGDPNPDYILGLVINATYKGFDFSMNWFGQFGNQVVKCYRQMERPYPNYNSDYLDRWQWEDINNNGVIDEGEGTSNTQPRVTFGGEPNQNWREFSDLYVHDAGYLRLKSLNIGYDFKQLVRKMPFEEFRIYFSALNLLTITDYTGMDPEVGYGSYYDEDGLLTDAYASGVDIGFYPSAKTYLIGLNVKF